MEQEFEGEEKEWRFLEGARKAGRSKELTWEMGASLCLMWFSRKILKIIPCPVIIMLAGVSCAGSEFVGKLDQGMASSSGGLP